MKALRYIKYFWFIAINWNVRLAWFSIIHEIKGEKKYGIHSTGTRSLNTNDLHSEDRQLLFQAEQYQGANYFLLDNMFSFLSHEGQFLSITDFGCGKGRILATAAHYGFKELIGVDISAPLLQDAATNLNVVKEKFPDIQIDLIHADAAKYIIDNNCNVFFFFNPFNEKIMLPVVKNILNSIRENEREIFVGYINPVHKEIFLSAGFHEVFHLQKYYYLECSILMYATPSLQEELV